MTGFPHFSIRTGVIAAALAAAAISSAPAVGQTSTVPAGSAVATPDNAVLLTVFLKHDESRPLAELNAQLAKQGFYKAFPPPGVEVVSWTVTMGIGQIVVLRLPAARLREVNRVLEDTAWGGVPDGVLSDLRLQGDRVGGARAGEVREAGRFCAHAEVRINLPPFRESLATRRFRPLRLASCRQIPPKCIASHSSDEKTAPVPGMMRTLRS